jgi:hypothetical protein
MSIRYPLQQQVQWQEHWDRSPSTVAWIKGSLCYHEALAVGDSYVRILDATDPVEWLGAQDGIAALRIRGDGSEFVEWGGRRFQTGTWLDLSHFTEELAHFNDLELLGSDH